MKNLLIRAVVAWGASAVALLIAGLLIDGFTVTTIGLVTASVLFAIFTVVLTYIVDALVDKHASWASWLVGLIVAFLALLATDLISDNLNIAGAKTWLFATLLVWLVAMVTDSILGRLLGPNGTD